MIQDAAACMLNRLVLQPAGRQPFATSYNLGDEQWVNDVPTGAGAYLLYTPGHFFSLPGGGTSVLYIGKGTSGEGLRRRLREHRRLTQETRDGACDRGYARYEWMTTHPARATYAATPALDSDSAEMEHRLLLTFADAFRVAPLGNAQSAWAEEVEEQESESAETS